MPDDEDPAEESRKVVHERDPRNYCERCGGGLTYPDVKAGVRVGRCCREEKPTHIPGRF